MTMIEKLEALFEPCLESLGYGIVRVSYGGDKQKNLQVMIERLDEVPISLDDCVTVSHHLSALLDVEDLIEESYNLEVTSPGLDRPLTKLKDFERFLGKKVKIETLSLVGGRKRFEGRLQEIKEEIILLEGEDKETSYSIPYEMIQRAKLIWQDPLASQKKGVPQKRKKC